MPKQRYVIQIEVEAGLNYLVWLEKYLRQVAEAQLTDGEAEPFIPWGQECWEIIAPAGGEGDE